MIPVKQTVLHDPANGKIGNCLNAVLASLLHIPIEDIPYFQDPISWIKDLNIWLRPYGLGYMNYEDYDIWTDHQELTGSHHLISGNTNRSIDVSHACVGLDSQVVFDPHPSDSGLTKINSYGVFVALRPWEVAQLNSMTVDKANDLLQSNKDFGIARDNEGNLRIHDNKLDWFKGNKDFINIKGCFSLEEMKAMVFLMEENEKAKPVSRNVTKEEHDLLMAATLRSSTVIAKGKFVISNESYLWPKQSFPISQDSRTIAQVATIMSINPTAEQEKELKDFSDTK